MKVPSPEAGRKAYINMTQQLLSFKRAGQVSASVYTQITDVELECDGFLNYDRSDKFSSQGIQDIVTANQKLIKG